jgi:hypothetical protein
MILFPKKVLIVSELPPNTVRDSLRARAEEWRESMLTATGNRAGVIGWRLKEKGERITIRARISGRNDFLPHFVGVVRASDSGSLIVGELRCSWYARLFTTVWFTAITSAPALAVAEASPAVPIGERLLGAFFLYTCLAALMSAGWWLVKRENRQPTAAMLEVLAMAAEGVSISSSETIAPHGA